MTTGFAEDEVVPAVFDLLVGDTTLMGLVTAVKDHVMAGVAKPYVTIDVCASADDGTKESPGEMLIIDINTWTEYKGKKQINPITKRIHNLLHETQMDLTSFSVPVIRVETVVTQKSEDTNVYGSVVRCRFLCRAKTLP